MKKAINNLVLEENSDSVLTFLFHFTLPEHKLNLRLFDCRDQVLRLMNIVLDPYRIKFQSRNNDTEALCPWIMVNKMTCSLLVSEFTGSNGAMIYHKIC